MKNRGRLILSLLTLSLTSCAVSLGGSSSISSSSSNSSPSSSSSSSASSSSINDSQSSSQSSSSSSSISQEETKSPYELFFEPTTKIELTMDFTAEALQNLSDCGGDSNNTTYHDVYHPCTLSVKINGEQTIYEEVGARMKGNTSRLFFMNNGNYMGGFVNFKVSFTQTFDDPTYPHYTPTSDTARADRLFLNEMKKFDLKWNKNYDATFTKELYAQHILEEEGILAQKANMCKLTIKIDGKAISGYSNIDYHLYETVDKPFLKRRMASKQAKGDLYKGSWPATLNEFVSYGVEDNYNGDHYVYDLKTNESTSRHTSLSQAISIINKTGPVTDTLKNEIQSVVDIDYLLKYCAMMWVIGNPDDFRYNMNNTYFYFNSGNNKLYLIPYDNDRCFGIMKDWAIDLSNSGPLDKRNCDGYDPNSGKQVESHLLWRTIIPLSTNSYPVVEEWEKTYIEYCNTYAKKYLDVNKFKTFTKSFVLAPSTNIDNAGADNQTFAAYASRKLATL